MKKTFLFFALLSVFFISCEKEESDSKVDMSFEDKISINIDDEMTNIFAKTLAKSISNNDCRSFIKKEAMKEFDGDYDILLAKVCDKKMDNCTKGESFSSFLSIYYSDECNEKSEVDFESFLYELIENHPLLQISMPEIADGSTVNWDENTFIPVVAVLPVNYDENLTKVIPAYDSFGNITYLDVDVCPEFPVIVVGKNERLIALRKNLGKNDMPIDKDPCYVSYHETDSYLYYLPVDCGGDEGVTGGGSSSSVYDRDNNGNVDNLHKARFVSKEAYRMVEKWPQGRPEFKVIVSYYEKEGSEPVIKTVTKILTKSDWISRYVAWFNLKTKYINLPIVTWNKDNMGNSMKYTWIEQDDSDNTVEINIAVSTTYENENGINGSIRVAIGDKDDEAGEAVVEYKDNTSGLGTEYNTGIVKFWVNQ